VLGLVIRGGTVVDGSGAMPLQANVGVRDGRIVFLDAASTASPKESIPLWWRASPPSRTGD
jgi:N-acyl-D-aspartate/D-glutamate deacylase